MNWDHIDRSNPIQSNQANFQAMGQNRIQLVRMWLSQWANFGAKWNARRCIFPACNPYWPEVSTSSPYLDHDFSIAMYAGYNRVWGQKDLINQRAHLWIQNPNHQWNNYTPTPMSGILTVTGFNPNTG